MDEDTARRAAKWWSNFLKSGSKLDHGDNSMTGFVAKGLGFSLQKKIMDTYTPEKIQMFEDVLVEELMKYSSYTRTVVLGVDYHPDKLLGDAAQAAEITVDSVLPWKTHMYIEEDGLIKVSYGYGAPLEII